MKNKIIKLCFMLLTFYSCGVDDPDYNNINYPTIISSLNDDELNKYKNEFSEQNNNKICTSLNKYGFCEYDLTPCMSRPILKSEIKDEREMIRKAKDCVVKNGKYTGVTSIDELKIKNSVGLGGCIICDGSDDDIKNIKWRIVFDNQVYKGYKVLDTQIMVFLDNNGAFMLGGNWYPEINIPVNDKYNIEKAKQNLYGHKISFMCWSEIKITVNEDNIRKESREVIVPVKLDDRIELRVTWEIFITDSQDNAMWVIYIDTASGEIIREYPMIIC